jgi:hypothetical protein
MLLQWIRTLANRPAGQWQARRARLDVTKFGIGFCPGCKRLRGVASAACLHCGSLAAVTEEA